MPWYAECKKTYIDFSNSTVFDKGLVYHVKKYDNKVMIRSNKSTNSLDWYTIPVHEAQEHFHKPVWFNPPKEEYTQEYEASYITEQQLWNLYEN